MSLFLDTVVRNAPYLLKSFMPRDIGGLEQYSTRMPSLETSPGRVEHTKEDMWGEERMPPKDFYLSLIAAVLSSEMTPEDAKKDIKRIAGLATTDSDLTSEDFELIKRELLGADADLDLRGKKKLEKSINVYGKKWTQEEIRQEYPTRKLVERNGKLICPLHGGEDIREENGFFYCNYDLAWWEKGTFLEKGTPLGALNHKLRFAIDQLNNAIAAATSSVEGIKHDPVPYILTARKTLEELMLYRKKDEALLRDLSEVLRIIASEYCERCGKEYGPYTRVLCPGCIDDLNSAIQTIESLIVTYG